MLLLADSGSSKTDWCIIGEGKIRFSTIGMNPLFTSENDIILSLENNFPKSIDKKSIKTINFFGAGCSGEKNQEHIKNSIQKLFPSSNISVNSDLLAASIAQYGNRNGIILILGTGANIAYYDGHKNIQKRPSLGYILGDEGSGAYLGKCLLSEYFKDNLPKNISESFYNKYSLSKEQALQKIYTEPFPNKYLASFTVFLKEHIDNDHIKSIVSKAFSILFKDYINHYKNYSTEIRCVGSIGFHFDGILSDVANKNGFVLASCIEKPIDNLIEHYHEKHNPKTN